MQNNTENTTDFTHINNSGKWKQMCYNFCRGTEKFIVENIQSNDSIVAKLFPRTERRNVYGYEEQ